MPNTWVSLTDRQTDRHVCLSVWVSLYLLWLILPWLFLLWLYLLWLRLQFYAPHVDYLTLTPKPDP